jgi:AAA+ superfamily predicted ATPase
LVEEYNLTEDEVVVLIIIIYDKLNGYFNTGTDKYNHLEILIMMYLDISEAVRNVSLFDENRTLIGENLIEKVEYRMSPFRNKNGLYFTPSEMVMVELLGEYGRELSLPESDSSGRGMNRGDSLNTYNPRVNLEDVVLPEETKNAVMEALAIVEQKELIYDEWGIDRVIEKGKGIILLFYGLPGTGKSMTAEALASYLDKEVCSINIAQLENCFVGVTEKNIEEVFKRAKEEDLFLLLDECDSLISSRSGGSRSINKYYNKVVNMLLREIEEFEGVMVMTTNRSDFLDEALERRVALRVRFNMPSYEERVRIWDRFLSLGDAVSEEVDVERLAGEYGLSGGEIKNAFIAGARIGAKRVKEDGGERLITMSDLLKGCKMAKEGVGVKKEKRLGF